MPLEIRAISEMKQLDVVVSPPTFLWDPYLTLIVIFIDCEAGEIIRLVVSVRLSVCLSVCLSVHQRSIQNGRMFKMVVVSTSCAIAVDHAFNYLVIVGSMNYFLVTDGQTEGDA